MRQNKKLAAVLMGIVFLLILGQTTASYAGTWLKEENGGYQYVNDDGSQAKGWLEADGTWHYFDEAGRMETGWIMDQNRYYYLSPSTGEWIIPPVNEDTVKYLMMNGLADAGLYQDEENLDIRIESAGKTTIVVTVGKIDRPESFRGFAQYRVDRKSRRAEAVVGGEDLVL